MGVPAFEFVEGATSDLSFVARGATLSEVFRAAAAALLEASVEEPDSVRETERRRVALAEPDAELLLLAFLNELVYLRDAAGLLLRARRVEVHDGTDGARLEAELAGEPIDRARHHLAADVKAATAHGLRLAREADGWRASVTLDV
jgi:SHS2 domain-containing protein